MCCKLSCDYSPKGLDAAGKTTMLYKLKLGEVVTTIPTIGRQKRMMKRFCVHDCVHLM